MKTLAAFIIGASLFAGAVKTEAQVAVGVNISVAPPAIPVYVQPPCPTEGFMWTPGYWAYGAYGYYWVPGVWLAPPRAGFLWTPGYWGFAGGFYGWHGGYWGPHVGFYGGINYGFGYGGLGFYGGRWEGGAFRYNTAVWHVNNSVVHNTYNESPAVGPGASHAAFNGAGGVTASPTPGEESAMHEEHMQPSSAQMQHEKAMSTNRNQLASVNKGSPRTTAMGTVGGQRFNNGGHAMVVNHTAAHAGTAAHSNMQQHHTGTQHAAQHAQMHSGAVHSGGSHMGGSHVSGGHGGGKR